MSYTTNTTTLGVPLTTNTTGTTLDYPRKEIRMVNNESLDMEDWHDNEVHKFIKWFVAMHHPEAIEQFQAIRKIERANEEQEAREQEARRLEIERQMLQQKYAQLQNSPYYTTSSITSQAYVTEQKSFWERAKELAGYRKTEHGDYY